MRKVSGNTLQQVDKFKYLGVVFTSNIWFAYNSWLKKVVFVPFQVVALYPVPFFLIRDFSLYGLTLAFTYQFAAGLQLAFRFLALIPCGTSSLVIVWFCSLQCAVTSTFKMLNVTNCRPAVF